MSRQASRKRAAGSVPGMTSGPASGGAAVVAQLYALLAGRGSTNESHQEVGS